MAINEVTFEIQKHFGVINKRNDGWTKELNLIAWNGNPPKYDIRDWDSSHERMSRGITLFENDAESLYEILKSVFESEN